MKARIAEHYRGLLDGLARAGGVLTEREGVAELRALLELSSALGSELSAQEMLDAVLLTVMRQLGTAQGAAFVLGKDNRYECRAARGMAPVTLDAALPSGATEPEMVDASQAEGLVACGLALLCPVTGGGRPLAALGIGRRADGRDYTEAERAFMLAAAACGAATIESKLVQDELRDTNRRLSLRVFQLSGLLDVSRELTASFDEGAVKSLTVTTVMGHLVVSRCALYLDDPDGLVLAHERGVDVAGDLEPLARAESRELSGALAWPLPTRELPHGVLRARLIRQGLTTVVPLRAGGRCAGLIALGERVSGAAFGDGDWELVSTVGRQALAALESLRLQRVQIDKQRQDRELQIAREIQRSLFPRSFPCIPGYSVAGATRSCHEVGGDYFDVIALERGQWALIVADVSGKGVPASILMASLHASLHALAGTASPAQTMERLNRFLYASTQPSKFATVFYAQLDADRQRLSYVNGGHLPPLLLTADGGVRRLDAGGAAVGLIEDATYEAGHVDLAAGDRVAMVTDGVTEARSSRDEEFGEARLMSVLRGSRARTEDAVESLMAAAQGWSSAAEYSDDLTALVLDVDEAGGGR